MKHPILSLFVLAGVLLLAGSVVAAEKKVDFALHVQPILAAKDTLPPDVPSSVSNQVVFAKSRYLVESTTTDNSPPNDMERNETWTHRSAGR